MDTNFNLTQDSSSRWLSVKGIFQETHENCAGKRIIIHEFYIKERCLKNEKVVKKLLFQITSSCDG